MGILSKATMLGFNPTSFNSFLYAVILVTRILFFNHYLYLSQTNTFIYSIYYFLNILLIKKYLIVSNLATDICNLFVHNIFIMNIEEKLKLLGRNIAKYRKNKKYSQNTFAEIVDVSREHIAKVETAKRCSSLSLIFKTADALGVTEDKLFDFT